MCVCVCVCVCLEMNCKKKNWQMYGINFVPIKINVIFQETYENINWNGIKCLWNWKNK